MTASQVMGLSVRGHGCARERFEGYPGEAASCAAAYARDSAALCDRLGATGSGGSPLRGRR